MERSGVHPLDVDVVFQNFFISCLMNALVSNANIFGLLSCYVRRQRWMPVLFSRTSIKNTNEVTQHVAEVIPHKLEELIYV